MTESNGDPNQINLYALGIIKVGHTTREFSLVHGNKTITPLVNEPILFQRIKEGLFQDDLGLVQCTINSGDSPKDKLVSYISEYFDVKIGIPKFRCKVLEIQKGTIQTVHNLFYVYSQRIPHLPETELEGIEIEPINIPEIYQIRYCIHPTHYEIIKKMVLTTHNGSDVPAELEVIVEPRGKTHKPTSIVWTT